LILFVVDYPLANSFGCAKEIAFESDLGAYDPELVEVARHLLREEGKFAGLQLNSPSSTHRANTQSAIRLQ